VFGHGPPNAIISLEIREHPSVLTKHGRPVHCRADTEREHKELIARHGPESGTRTAALAAAIIAVTGLAVTDRAVAPQPGHPGMQQKQTRADAKARSPEVLVGVHQPRKLPAYR